MLQIARPKPAPSGVCVGESPQAGRPHQAQEVLRDEQQAIVEDHRNHGGYSVAVVSRRCVCVCVCVGGGGGVKCKDGEDSVLVRRPDQNTPDEVFYQVFVCTCG